MPTIATGPGFAPRATLASVRIAAVLPIDPAVRGSGLAHRSRFWVRVLAGLGEVTTLVVPVAGPAPTQQVENQLTVACERLDHPWLPERAQNAPEYLGARYGEDMEPFDLIVAHRSYLGPFCVGLRGGSSASLVIDLDDDDASFFAATGDSDRANRYRQLIDWLGERVDLLTAANETRGAVVVPNSVQLPVLDQPISPTVVASILMVGNFTYAPNIEGARWFEQEVLPKITASQQVSFVMAGPGSDDVSDAGCGFVEDLADLYRSASVVVVPILTGSGSRIKALEAWAHGVPVVGTSLGLSGLDAGGSARVADHPVDFAAGVIELLKDPVHAADLGSAGRAHVASTFAEDVVGATTRALLSSVADGTYQGQILPVSGLTVTEVEGGLVVYEPTLDTAHQLNSAAAIVFTLVAEARSIDQLVAEVGDLFGNSVEQSLVSQTVDDLVKKRLLERV